MIETCKNPQNEMRCNGRGHHNHHKYQIQALGPLACSNLIYTLLVHSQRYSCGDFSRGWTRGYKSSLGLMKFTWVTDWPLPAWVITLSRRIPPRGYAAEEIYHAEITQVTMVTTGSKLAGGFPTAHYRQ
jgi:hypothetical protein